jgi:hypothetical protein
MLAAVMVAACNAGPRSIASAMPLANPTVTATPEVIATATIEPNPTVAASMTAWRVDVFNGPRPIVIWVRTEYFVPTASGDYPFINPYRVEANQRVTLFSNDTPAHRGTFELLQAFDDLPSLGHCHIFQTTGFPADSFTIVINGDASGPNYSAAIMPGLPPLLPFATWPTDSGAVNCSG